MKITLANGREFTFGDNADEQYANELVSALLDAEKALADAQALNALPTGDVWHDTARLKTAVFFAEADINVYQETTRPDYRWPGVPSVSDSQNDPLTPGERVIVAELREIRRAVMADREMVENQLTGELTRSRVVLPTTEEI